MRSALLFKGLILLLTLVLGPGYALGQPLASASEVRVQQGDVLQLKVPGNPQFDLDLTVGADGSVEIPQIGEIRVGGLTLAEAERVIRQSLRIYDPSVSDISLGLGRTEGFQMYVLGQVAQPGLYSFVTEPSLWDLLRAAGGPTENANLRSARLVREEDDRMDVQVVDLAVILAGESGPDYEIRSGDTLMVPALPESGISSLPAATGVQVFGSVDVPTVVDIREATPLLDILMMAGSPSDDAELQKIWWVHRQGGSFHSTRVNLEKFLQQGDPLGNPLVYPGDAVHVSYQRDGWFQRNFPMILGTLATSATVWLAYDRISEE